MSLLGAVYAWLLENGYTKAAAKLQKESGEDLSEQSGGISLSALYEAHLNSTANGESASPTKKEKKRKEKEQAKEESESAAAEEEQEQPPKKKQKKDKQQQEQAEEEEEKKKKSDGEEEENEKEEEKDKEEPQQNGSTEATPKKKEERKKSKRTPNTPFQRVQIDKIQNAKGRGTTWGAKANEVLSQVRGKGFRHEKTKKKRGTYRGGQLDLEPKSIRLDASDDDE